MARAKKPKLVESEIEQSITINVPGCEGTVAVTNPNQVTMISGMEVFLRELESEIAGLDGIASVINAKLIKIRIENLIKKARAQL